MRFKETSAMSKAEMDFNLRDLDSFKAGRSDVLSSLIPGIQIDKNN